MRTPLEQKIDLTQNQILNLLNQIGYGTACNPMSSGEIHAINKAFAGKPPGVVFDVGSYHGEFIQMCIPHYPGNIYHSFEPDPVAYQNLINQHLPGNIMYNNIAISISDGQEILYNHQDDSGLSSLYKRDFPEFTKEQSVVTMRLSSYFKKMNLTQIDYLKLDIEGMEFLVLKDSIELIQKKLIKNIQFEFGGCNIDSRTYMNDFYQLLLPYYNIYRIHPEGLVLLNEYSYLYEVFQPVNYFCELK